MTAEDYTEIIEEIGNLDERAIDLDRPDIADLIRDIRSLLERMEDMADQAIDEEAGQPPMDEVLGMNNLRPVTLKDLHGIAPSLGGEKGKSSEAACQRDPRKDVGWQMKKLTLADVGKRPIVDYDEMIAEMVEYMRPRLNGAGAAKGPRTNRQRGTGWHHPSQRRRVKRVKKEV